MALIILLIVSIVCTSIERARIESANARCKQITYLALDSCFSGYGREIFEEYGLMMLWESKDSFQSEYENYVDKNCNYRKDMISKPTDFLSIDYCGSEMIEVLNATSNDGELIEKQICDYMEIALPKEVIDELLNNSKTLSQSEGINEFSEKMDVCSETLTNVEESVEDIYDNIEKLKKIEGNPEEMLLNMRSKISDIKLDIQNGNGYSSSNELYQDFLEEFKAFNEYITSVDDKLRNIMTYSNDYLVNSSNAQDEVDSIKKYVDSKKESYQNQIIESLMGEIKAIESDILNLEKDIYGVQQNNNYVINQRKIINNIRQNFENVEMVVQSNNGLKLSEIEDKDKLIEDISLAINNALINIDGFNKDIIKIDYEKKSGKEQKNEIVDFVEKIKEDGVINYVVAGDVSNKNVNISELPSNVCELNDGKGWKNYGLAEENIRKAMVGQYIFENFSNYTLGVKGECLDYEIEYILKGKSSDKENLSEVIDDILLIRESFNLIYLLRDSEKRQQAYTLAMTITGFTGMPAIIRITQVLILAAWAYAESLIDVKELLEGKRVSIIKTSAEWNLSLMGVTNLSPKKDKKQSSSGLLYKDYLRVFLFSQNKALQIYRILDLVQLNMAKQYNNEYKVSDCILSVNIKSEYMVERLFTDIGFIRSIIKQKNKGYIFEINQEYFY